MLMKIAFIPFLITSFLLMISFHPITKSLILVFLVLIYSFMMNLFFMNSWQSFIIFIAFVGGILVMFIYTISLLENEIMIKNNFKFNNLIYFLLFLILTTIFIKNINSKGFEMDILNHWQKKILFLNFIFSKSYFKPSLLLILYLFLSMISMMKIINSKKNNY